MTELSFTTSQLRRSMTVAMICTSVVGTTMGLTWPLLALILDNRQVSSSLIGLSSASQSLAVLAVAPFAPRVIGQHGVVKVIAVCMVLAIISLAMLPLYVDVYFWFPIRLMLGASVSLLFIAGETWINHIAKEDARGRTVGMFGFLWSAGFAIGPAIVGLVGIEGWWPFLAAISLVLVAGLSLPFAHDVAPHIHEQPSAIPMRQLLFALPAAILAAPILGAIDAINDSLLPLYGLRNGLGQNTAILVLTVLFLGTTVGHLPMGWFADRMDRWLLLRLSTMATILMTCLVPFTINDPWLVWPVIALWGAALGGIWTVAIVLIGQHFTGSSLARVNALYTVLYSTGSIVGPVTGGVLMDWWRPVAVPALVGMLLVAYLPIALYFSNTTFNCFKK